MIKLGITIAVVQLATLCSINVLAHGNLKEIGLSCKDEVKSSIIELNTYVPPNLKVNDFCSGDSILDCRSVGNIPFDPCLFEFKTYIKLYKNGSCRVLESDALPNSCF